MTTLLLPIVVPLGAALLALLLPGRSWRAAIGVAGALATAAVALAQVGVRGTWAHAGFPLGPIDVDLALRADGFSSWATAFVALMALAASLYSVAWFRDRGGAPGRTYGLILLATAGAATALLADHAIVLVVGWEIVTLALFLLVVSGRPQGSEGAAKAFVLLGLGDLALLVGFVLLDMPDFAALRSAPLATTGATPVLAWLLLFTAACAKAGAMPLHSWVPSMAKGTSAAVMAFLPGSVDKVLGIYLLVRLTVDWFAPTPAVRMVVMVVGVVTMLGAVLMALVQHDLRRLLAYHAVSQVGYMLLGIGTGTIIGVLGGVFHMVNHAIYKSCLFLGAGQIERQSDTCDLGRLGGLGRTFPVTFGAMFVAALAISGIPPLNGFASKWLVYQGCVAVGMPLFLVAALLASALTLASFVKLLHSVFWGPRPAALDGVEEDRSPGLRLPLIVLAVLCLVLGVVPGLALDRYVGPAVGLEPDGALTGADALAGDPAAWALVHGAVPVAHAFELAAFRPGTVAVLLLLGATLALFVAHLGNFRSRRVRSVFVGGEPIDRDINRFPGTEFYGTVQDLPGIGAVLRSGERGALDPYEVVLRLGRPLVAALRALHRGLATDYVAWCLLGTAVLFVVLVLGR